MFHRPRTDDKPATDAGAENGSTASSPSEAVTARAEADNRGVQAFNTIQIKQEEKKMTSKDDQDRQAASRTGEISTPAAAYGAAPAAQPPVARPMPGTSYAPYPASTPANIAANPYAPKQSPQGRRLVIGEGITMSGEIEACEYLVVEGTVEAALKGASILEIAESGTFYGTVEINEATIAGRFEGDIAVNGRLTVTSTGSITGTIAYKELAVESGATLDGKISPLGAADKSVRNKTEGRGKDIKVRTGARNDNAGDSNELPFAAGTTV